MKDNINNNKNNIKNDNNEKNENRAKNENNKNNGNNIINENENENGISIDGKKYIMEKMGLIFVSNRLGLYNISSDYYPSIKNILDCKECIGFVGGKKNTNSASYFIGYYDNNLLYLDPHHNNKRIKQVDDDNIITYINKTLYKLKFSSLNSAITIGFLFRNIKEFNQLLTFFRNSKKEKYFCFEYSEKMGKKENKNLNEIYNSISTGDDF